jgi:tyrosinase
MPVRRNIVTNAAARQSYVRAAILLKSQFTGVTTQMLGIPGPNRQVSTWDRFVAWHSAAMGIAHRGPAFLPWHRLMLRTLERLMGQALSDPNFGLPYWDWAADGQLTRAQQLSAAIWNNNCMGSASTAPGQFTLAAFPIRLEEGGTGNLVQTNRSLRRSRGAGVPGIASPNLPRRASTAAVLASTVNRYDVAPWNRNSAAGMRNRLEGWLPSNDLHNLVHIWVGGDMLPSTSPNDPVFYLNHCNVDRIWERWMQLRGRQYQPTNATVGAPVGQRLNDPIPTPFGASVTAANLLNMSAIYTYDSLVV